MSEYIIDETGHKGGEEEMLTLAQENEALRKRVQELEEQREVWMGAKEVIDKLQAVVEAAKHNRNIRQKFRPESSYVNISNIELDKALEALEVSDENKS